MTLVKFYAPNGVMLSEILHSCFCSHYNKTDVEVQQELGIGRTSFYKMKKQALGYLGFYFYEIVVPQAKDKRFKPSLVVEDGEVVTMITHLVKTEVLPFAGWDDRTHLDGLIGFLTGWWLVIVAYVIISAIIYLKKTK